MGPNYYPYRNRFERELANYLMITFSIILMAAGVYFFKFPNNFSFGGVTGYSTIVSRLTGMSASRFTMIVNMLLLVLGFIMVGKEFGVKTVYASVLFSVALEVMERCIHTPLPLTSQPLLELAFAVFIPGVASAILFNIGASSGGTDIIALILKKHTSFNIGTVLFIVDLVAVLMAFFVFGAETGLFSVLGLMCKSLVIDSVIESINLCKCFTIICEDPEPICQFIIQELKRSATTYEATGAYAHRHKTIIMTTMSRSQALRLRNYVRAVEPHCFMVITSSSEIIGKNFLNS